MNLLMADFPSSPLHIYSPRVLRRLLAIVMPAALLTGGVVLALYYQDIANEYAISRQASTHRVDLHSDILLREMKAVRSDLLYLANQAVLREYLSGRAASRQAIEDEYLLFCRHRAMYDQIRYLDRQGNEAVRINYNDGRPAIVPPQELQPKASRYYFAQAMLLEQGEVFTSPFDLNIEHGQIEQPLKPVIRFATPVFDAQGVKRGILILNYLGAVLLNKLSEVSVGESGQVWLLNREGFFLRGPRPEDEWGFMLGHDRTFASSFADEWPEIAGAGRGQFRTPRGLFTFRTLSTRPEPAGGLPGPDADNAELLVVGYTPARVLDGSAPRLLERLLLLYGVVLLLLIVLAWYLAYAGVLRRDHERHLAESAARLRSLSTRLLTAQEDERRSLSRDLHDELGQVVTSMTLDLQRAAQTDEPGRKADLIGRALHGASCLLDHIHQISTRLRPTLLDDLGLKDAVQSYLCEYEQRTGITTHAELHFEPGTVPRAVSENLYRILQEALTNVAKHARAAEVFVALCVSAGQAILTVRDSGVGLVPDAADSKRLGILGMRERAELLDGRFVLKAAPGQGTRVEVVIPFDGRGTSNRDAGGEA
jgi:signal transduction histidine kinase